MRVEGGTSECLRQPAWCLGWPKKALPLQKTVQSITAPDIYMDFYRLFFVGVCGRVLLYCGGC